MSFTNTGAIAFRGTGARTLTLTGGNEALNTLTPIIGDCDGPTSLVKAGGGTWVRPGVHTFSGQTTVQEGRLIVNGATSSPVSIEDGGYWPVPGW